VEGQRFFRFVWKRKLVRQRKGSQADIDGIRVMGKKGEERGMDLLAGNVVPESTGFRGVFPIPKPSARFLRRIWGPLVVLGGEPTKKGGGAGGD
jgi:hypothetical protein